MEAADEVERLSAALEGARSRAADAERRADMARRREQQARHELALVDAEPDDG